VLADGLFFGFEKGDVIECDDYMICDDFIYHKYFYDDDGKIIDILCLYGKLVENHPQWFEKIEE